MTTQGDSIVDQIDIQITKTFSPLTHMMNYNF